MSKTGIAVLAFTISVFTLTGCATFEPFQRSVPTPAPATVMDAELKSLPPPKEPIVAAVYAFRDQTGQYKTSSTGTSFSTAITQGGTSILMRALQQSGWFVPVEREGLSDLLNERKIIRSTRDNYLGDDGKKLPALPPLMYAGVVLEGGIISYDSNILTGGEGAKFFGTSASGLYHEDQVTVYLRAVSTQNGRDLLTVTGSKTVLSQEIDVGFYSYVSYTDLAQAEAGFTYNEPVDVAVTEAIQEAVKNLVVEGVYDGYWSLKFPGDTTSTAFENFAEQKRDAEQDDYMGRPVSQRRALFGVSLNSGAQIYNGDYANSEFHIMYGGSVKMRLAPSFYAGLSLGRGELSALDAFKDNYDYLDVKGIYNLMPDYVITPFVSFGAGVLVREWTQSTSPSYPIDLVKSSFATVNCGLGVEYLASDNVGLSFEFNDHYALSDRVDGLVGGKYFDWFWTGQLGINVYFGP